MVLGNQRNNSGTIEITQYLNTLKDVQGFCHCPKSSKGFRLGLEQCQKVSFEIDRLLTLKGSSRGTKTHLHTLVGINDNLVNNLPLCHWWKLQISPLERAYFIKQTPPLSILPLPSLFNFFSPFGINGKGYFCQAPPCHIVLLLKIGEFNYEIIWLPTFLWGTQKSLLGEA